MSEPLTFMTQLRRRPCLIDRQLRRRCDGYALQQSVESSVFPSVSGPWLGRLAGSPYSHDQPSDEAAAAQTERLESTQIGHSG